MSDSETSEIEFSSTSSLSEIPTVAEVKPKTRRGRPRKYETTQERINTSAKKQCAEKREKTKLKHKLIKEGHQNQFQLINKLQTLTYETEYINEVLKNIDKHEIKQN